MTRPKEIPPMFKHLAFGFIAGLTAFSGATARAEQKTEFYPAHVQVCSDRQSEGQGTAQELWINYSETEEGKGSCTVASYYGYEYGCDTGFRSMCAVTALSTAGMKCSVERQGSQVKVSVEKGRGRARVVHAEGCALTLKGDVR
jgi:hypothetical protein